MANLGTERLKIVNDQPEVTKLWNGRYRLEFFLDNDGKKEDWYAGNIGNILPAFGTLQADEFGIGNWEPRDDEAYDNMRCIKAGTEYMPKASKHYVKLVYETLSGSLVLEKDDDTDYSVNGLKRVSRSLIAKPGVSYDKTVGVTQEDDLYLSAYKIEDTDAYRRIEEVWMEAGILSQTEDFVGSQKSISIESIGPDPSTPAGYSPASKQESDYQGLQTNRFTFLKDDVELSRSDDLVASQKAIVIEQFNGTPATPSGYALASTQVSDVEGVPTKRYTFLKSDVTLSQSEDLVGSQLAIVIEQFDGVPSTPAGYSIANKQESDVDGIKTNRYTFLKDDVELSSSEDKVGSQNAITEEWFKPTAARKTKTNYALAREEVSDVGGIPTERYTFLKSNTVLSTSEDLVGSQKAEVIEVFDPSVQPTPTNGGTLAKKDSSDVDGIDTVRYTFLKPSILSVDQVLNSGTKQVVVTAFDMSEVEVDTALTEVTSSHELISKSEDDHDGIKTTKLIYELDESYTEDYELNGLKRISLVELSSSSFAAQTIGIQSAASPTNGLYLASQEVENGGTIKVRTSVWIQSGILQTEERNLSEGVTEITKKYIGVKGLSIGPVVNESVDNYAGLKTYTVVELQDGTGASIVSGGSNLVHTFSQLVDFTYPGIVSINHDRIDGTAVVSTGYQLLSFQLIPPVQLKVEAEVHVIFQTSASVAAGDYTYDSSYGFWNPSSWAETYQGGVAHGPSPFSETQGLRGYRIDPDLSNIETFEAGTGAYTYYANGARISYSPNQSIQTATGEQWEYTNNGGAHDVLENLLWTGGTSGAKGLSTSDSPAIEGIIALDRTGTGANTTPFIEGETITSVQAGGNPKTLGRYLGQLNSVVGTSDSGGYDFSINGTKLYGNTAFQMKLSGGPENPSGKKWVLDIDIKPAFNNIDGTTYYKKTIVTADIA